MTTAKFTTKDQNWADESTVYWFDVAGDSQLPDGQYGVVHSGPEVFVVDFDGGRLQNESHTARALVVCVVTDELIAE